MSDIAPGRYRHYKGKEYTVLGVAQHSETHDSSGTVNSEI